MRELAIPTAIRAALEQGAALVVSVSGGKDSDAMLRALVHWRQVYGWTGPLLAVHADLGRAEWPQTMGHVVSVTGELDVPLDVVQRTDGADLVTYIERRKDKLAGSGTPFWPSSASRYCTSDLKRGPLNTFLRQFPFVISAEGIRAEESKARSMKPVGSMREISTSRLLKLTPDEALRQWGGDGRLSFTWNPIFEWALEDVWNAMGHTGWDLDLRRALYAIGQTEQALDGWRGHPAYVFGNERLSCALCVLAKRSDLLNGIRHNPALAQTYAEWEEETGFTFKADVAISELMAHQPA